MKINSKDFIIGLLIGLAVGFLAFAYSPLGNRYSYESSPKLGFIYKYDKWSGNTSICRVGGTC